jgi:hypothetical protein
LPRNRELREDRARETRDPDASSWNWKDKPYSLGFVSPAASAANDSHKDKKAWGN